MTFLGVKSILEHKLRGLLTALGVIFGVSSVIAMLSIGEGASYEAEQQIRQLGSTNVILKSRKPDETSSGNTETRRMSIYGLTYQDANRIKTLFPQIEVHVPARVIVDRVRNGNRRLPCKIIGTVPWFLDNSGLHISNGRFLVQHDVDKVSNVCVLTDAVAKELFPLSWPLGQKVNLGAQAYTVIGILRVNQKSAKDNNKTDVHSVYIPISAARNRFGEILVRRETGSVGFEKVELHELILSAPSNEAVIPLADSVRTLLTHFHQKKDFEIIIPLELLKQAEATKRIFNIVLGSIAAISLLVGGIGIMNIMLASVTERTREIGIRRALGATQADIVLQFLAEALILSLTGGVIGIGLGMAIPLAVSHFAGLITITTPNSLCLAFGISLFTGVVFGIYPATRAAALSPIEALRHE